MNAALFLFIALVALNIADAYTTLRILKLGGRERNPVMAWAFRHLGPLPALLAFKAAVLALVWFNLPIFPLWAMAGMNAFYVYVVHNNLRVLRGLKP